MTGPEYGCDSQYCFHDPELAERDFDVVNPVISVDPYVCTVLTLGHECLHYAQWVTSVNGAELVIQYLGIPEEHIDSDREFDRMCEAQAYLWEATMHSCGRFVEEVRGRPLEIRRYLVHNGRLHAFSLPGG